MDSTSIWVLIRVISAILNLRLRQCDAANLLKEIPFKTETINLVVDKHNFLRRGIDASNMRKLDWRTNLARLAQRLSNTCDTKHDQSRGFLGFDTIGVNSFVLPSQKSFGGSDAKKAIDDWFTGDLCYKYGKRGETDVCTPLPEFCTSCDPFVQLIWAETCAIGCAASSCSQIDHSDTTSAGVLFTCVYGPGGNIKGQSPYKKGKQCASCTDSCETGLCVLYQCDRPNNDSVILADSTTTPRTTSQTVSLPPTSAALSVTTAISTQVISDYSSLCSFWARAGECRKNRKYMFSTCPASCNCCKDKLVLNKKCVNQHQQCKTWASAGECSSNADYMEFYCPAACKLCRTGDSPAVMMPSSRPTSKKKSTRSKRFSRFFDLIA